MSLLVLNWCLELVAVLGVDLVFVEVDSFGNQDIPVLQSLAGKLTQTGLYIFKYRSGKICERTFGSFKGKDFRASIARFIRMKESTR